MVEAQAVFERDTLYPLGAPNVACFQDPQVNPFPVEYVTVEGSIAKFGTGGKTVDLCVTFYNQARLLEDFLAKCQGIDDADERYQCFRADPCRCEEENEGDQGAIDECFAGIGYCNGIQDAGLKAECQQTYAYDGDNADRDPSIESTLIYGHTVSFDVPEDDEEGHFAVSGIPISTELVVKVSGREQRWVDTYEFGAIIREARDGDDGRVARADGNVISLGAWRTIPGTALVPGGIQDGNGAVAGRLYDCGMEGRSVEADGQTRDASGYLGIENGTVGLLNDATRITYFNGNPNDTLPQPNRVTTDGLGLYAAIDVPGGPNRVSTAIYYDGELINVGARDLFLPPMSVGIVTFEGNILPAAW
jgi:hypothetical protein